MYCLNGIRGMNEKTFDTNDIMSCFKMSVDVNGIKRIEEYINKLEEENKMFNLELSGYRRAILQDKELMGLKEDKDKLQNNWNELKKWLGTRINTDKDYERNSHIKEKLQVEDYVIKQVILFMQELEQGNI